MRIRKPFRPLALATALLLLTACGRPATPPPTAESTTATPTGPLSQVEVVPTVITAGTPSPSPTPPICATLPAGVSLDVELISMDTVRLSGKGFEPGEQLILVLSSESRQRSQRIEYRPVEPVRPNGRFTITHRIEPLRDTRGRVLTNTWQVVLIHDDSALCQTVTLPFGGGE